MNQLFRWVVTPLSFVVSDLSVADETEFVHPLLAGSKRGIHPQRIGSIPEVEHTLQSRAVQDP
jgi:hypothetical protein